MLQRTFPCVLVAGARQVGKSTLLNHMFGKTHAAFVFDPVQDLYGARKDPDLFLRNNPRPLILDEIQHAPELVPALKRHIDQNRTAGRFLISGSQQWEVMRHLSESLAGRVAILELHGFCLAEVTNHRGPIWLSHCLTERITNSSDAFDLLRGHQSSNVSPVERIWRGAFPEVQSLEPAAIPAWMQGYVATYLERDIHRLTPVHDEMQFSSFLTLCATLTAQEWNYSQLGRDIGLSSVSARRWAGLLRGTYQLLELPAFSRSTVKRLSLRPKCHIMDTGLACYLMRISSPESLQGHPTFGFLFESHVVTDCLRQIQSMNMRPALHHYREHAGQEVDLIVELDGRHIPIEIKAASSAVPGDAVALEQFCKQTTNRAPYALLIYGGHDVLRIGPHTVAIPFDLL